MARITFDGKAEAVRDVKFNPVNPYWFAAAFDNGAVQVFPCKIFIGNNYPICFRFGIFV